MLMSFVGAIGTLMTETGLSEVLKSFGVLKNVNRKEVSNECESYALGC